MAYWQAGRQASCRRRKKEKATRGQTEYYRRIFPEIGDFFEKKYSRSMAL